ncbi:MAG TPA: SMC family ATPase, partial [Acidimicrobiia bacterium]|nr:SMC family ATPase [Acidimicrobiia bacterium]
MRPLTIEVEGFSAYRSPVTVDFTGVDFFSLAGPTGSGKSSLIDAMIFALYGRVPRLGGNAVAPAITAGADRARVRLDFEVAGKQYTAVRLAARTPSGGASVREARLQEGEKVLASRADEVTAAVEDLLKLSYEDFTRTVVLPQGEFARFLTATKSERQGLLRHLLGMDVYTTVRELARIRAEVAGERAQDASRALEALQPADEKEMKAAALRLERLVALSEALPEHEKRLDDLESALSEAIEQKSRIDHAIERVDAIGAPARLADLDDLITKARSDVVDAEERRVVAVTRAAEAEAALEGLPAEEKLEAWAQAYLRLSEVDGRLQERDLAFAQARVAEAKDKVRSGLADLADVRSRLDGARHDHSASLLTATLVVGEPCPVCDQHVAEVPERPASPDLDALIEEERRLAAVVDDARETADEAREDLTRMETDAASLLEQQSDLRQQLAQAPAMEELEGMRAHLRALGVALEEARRSLADRQAEEEQARSVLE